MADGKIAFLGGEGRRATGPSREDRRPVAVVVPADGHGLGPGAGQAQMFLPMFKPMAGVFGTVGGKVRSGDYANADAMLTDLAARLTGAMAMPGMNSDDDTPIRQSAAEAWVEGWAAADPPLSCRQARPTVEH